MARRSQPSRKPRKTTKPAKPVEEAPTQEQAPDPRWPAIRHILSEMVGSDLRSLRDICTNDKQKIEGLPAAGTFCDWVVLDSPSGIAEQYARAREAQAEQFADEIRAVADDGSRDYKVITKHGEEIEVADYEHIQRSKLRVDTLKWIMARRAPKRFGDRLDVTSGGKPLEGKRVTMEVFGRTVEL